MPKILTWNLGYWQRHAHHDEAWDYLCEGIKPDLAFLQEVKPPSYIPRHRLVFKEIRRGWGTAIFAPSLALSKETVSSYPGRVAAASILCKGHPSLFIASIHAPIVDGRVFPHLATIFTELESCIGAKSAIVGGDLNSARLAEKVWPGYGHAPFWERIDEGQFWVDCCRKFHATEIQTFFRDNSAHPFQDDHIFVSCDLRDRIVAADVINNELTRRGSDHIPLVVELESLFDTTDEPPDNALERKR